MLLPIKPIIDRRPRRNGTSVISIQYCFSSDKRILLYTGLAVPPRYWNKKLLRISPDLPEEYRKADQLNLRLQKMIRTAEDIVSYALQQKVEDPVAFLKMIFQPDFDAATLPQRIRQLAEARIDEAVATLDFFYQLDDYIKTKTRKVSTGMVRIYNVMKHRLQAFQKYKKQKITFESFSYNFYESFVNYLTYEHRHMGRKVVLRGLKKKVPRHQHQAAAYLPTGPHAPQDYPTHRPH